MTIETPRLELIAATFEHCDAEIRDTAELSRMLRAGVPPEWPPPLNDAGSQQFFLTTLRDRPDEVGWCVWYFILREGNSRTVVGNGGFKGAPRDGTVEIGYSILPAYQRRGYALEAVEALVRWAFEDARMRRVIAETYPDLHASLGVLRKAGFRRCEGASAPEIVRFELLHGTSPRECK